MSQKSIKVSEVLPVMEMNTKLADAITAAAIKLFRERGFDRVSVNDICLEAGIARSSFYRAFSNKKEIIRYVLENTQSRSIVGIGDLVSAENDFERMWCIGSRYIDIVLEFGPKLIGTLMQMELKGELDALAMVHSVDDWFIRLTRNCQQVGTIRNAAPPEILGPMGVNAVYQVTYDWCSHQGQIPIRRRARQAVDLAPEYRWPELTAEA